MDALVTDWFDPENSKETESKSILKPISECLTETTAKIKEFIIALLKEEEIRTKTGGLQKPIKKINRYLNRLIEANVLPNDALTGNYLTQTAGTESNYFAEIELEGNRFFVNTTSSADSIQKGLESRTYEDFDTLSGICFFGKGTDNAIAENGEVLSITDIGSAEKPLDQTIKSLEIDGNLSLYEIEKITRYETFFNALKTSNPEKFKKAYISTPTIQYGLYLMDAYEKDLITNELLLQWIDEVEKKEELVLSTLQEKINVPVEKTSSSLIEIQEFIKESLQTGEKIELEMVLEMLCDKDQDWKEIVELGFVPKDWKSLINLSYQISMIKQNKHSHAQECSLVNVDDPLERRILSGVKFIRKALAKQSKPAEEADIIALFVHQKLLREEGESCLYYLEKTANRVAAVLDANKNLPEVN